MLVFNKHFYSETDSKRYEKDNQISAYQLFFARIEPMNIKHFPALNLVRAFHSQYSGIN